MFKKKKKEEPKSEPFYKPSAQSTPIEIAQRTTEIIALSNEAKAALDRLKAIKERVEALGGKIQIYGEPVSYFTGYGHNTTPAWHVAAEYCAKL